MDFIVFCTLDNVALILNWTLGAYLIKSKELVFSFPVKKSWLFSVHCMLCVLFNAMIYRSPEYLRKREWGSDDICFVVLLWNLWSGVIVSVYLILITECNLQLQLHELMETLSSTEPHYIRCIKPNSVLKPGIFENTNVLQQLRCSVRKISHTFLPKF